MKFFYTNQQQYQKELSEESDKYGDILLRSCCKTWNLSVIGVDCYKAGESVLSDKLNREEIQK